MCKIISKMDKSTVQNVENFSEFYFQTSRYKPINITYSETLDNQCEYYWLCGGVLLLALVLLGIHWVDQLLITFHDRRNVLTTKEIHHFRQGIRAYSDDFSDAKQDVTHYNKMPFNKHFEIDKKMLKMIEWGPPIKTTEFKSVQLAKLKIETTKNVYRRLTVAMKTTKPSCQKNVLLNILKEIKLMTYLGVHDNLVTFIGAHTKHIHNGVIYMITELCSWGSLKNYLKDNCYILQENYDGFWGKCWNDETDHNTTPTKSNVTFEDMLRWAHEIASGMEYLGSKNIIHGDLSARNVLLTLDKTAKISGFGKSRCQNDNEFSENFGVKEGPEIPMETLENRRWKAVEVVKRGRYSFQSDVWSFGVTLWEIFSFGENPYNGSQWLPNYLEKLGTGMRLEQPFLGNTDLYNLMFVCWAKRPKDRPKFINLKFVTALLLEIFRTRINSTHVPTKLLELINDSETLEKKLLLFRECTQ